MTQYKIPEDFRESCEELLKGAHIQIHKINRRIEYVVLWLFCFLGHLGLDSPLYWKSRY